jgi:hypothetical protein
VQKAAPLLGSNVGTRGGIVIRDDIGGRLIHLTKGESDLLAANTFLAIVQDRKLRGGTGCIEGGYQWFVSVTFFPTFKSHNAQKKGKREESFVL